MAAVLEPQQPSTAVGAPIVRVTALRKSYGTNEVLKGIDLDVKRGEVIAIIGKSGSGKSTLLRCINGLEVFQEGSLTVDGKPLLHESAMAMRELRQRVGMIFQSFNLFPHLTVGKNVMLAPTLVKKRGSLEAASQARKLLTRVGLAEKFDAMPDQLSGGQQQRVAIARALAMEHGRAAVRRNHIGARPRTGGRGAARGGVAGRRGHDAPDGHARDELRAQGQRPRDLHAPRPRARDGAAGGAVRQSADGGAQAVPVVAA
jgi:predicted ABC-type transport system involved in lysophospholipase L1 biosynthesis ATPase subunit